MVAEVSNSSSNNEEQAQIKTQESNDEYVELTVAMKMADRSSKTIRNWLKEDLIKGKKENPDNPKSKWLIHRESLMAHLATAVEVDPPRRNPENLPSLEPTNQILQTPSENTEISKEEFQQIQEELRTSLKNLETFRIRILELEKELAISNSKNEQKDEIIELLKSSQPNLETIFKEHERKVESLQEQLQATEKQLSIIRFAYDQEAGKGFFARLFTAAPELKMLEMKEETER